MLITNLAGVPVNGTPVSVLNVKAPAIQGGSWTVETLLLASGLVIRSPFLDPITGLPRAFGNKFEASDVIGVIISGLWFNVSAAMTILTGQLGSAALASATLQSLPIITEALMPTFGPYGSRETHSFAEYDGTLNGFPQTYGLGVVPANLRLGASVSITMLLALKVGANNPVTFTMSVNGNFLPPFTFVTPNDMLPDSASLTFEVALTLNSIGWLQITRSLIGGLSAQKVGGSPSDQLNTLVPYDPTIDSPLVVEINDSDLMQLAGAVVSVLRV